MNLSPSPLFEPVLWDGDGFRILDELSLPERVDYIQVKQISTALAAVKDMKTRAFGQVLTFLYSGALLGQQYHGRDASDLREALALMTEQFCAARPTFDFRGLGSSFSQWFATLPGDRDLGEWIAGRARGFAAEILKARQDRAKRTAAVLPNPAHVLTHCNVSGELVAIAQFCSEQKKPFSVIATETRPYLQGSRLTAWELSEAGVAVSLIPDGAVAQVIAGGDINAVIVGSDRCAQNGDIINKVGTYPIAVLAKHHAIPFYALVQPPGALVCGEDLEIEERPADELLYFHGRRLGAENADRLSVRYPAFDVTPAAVITNLIGFDGLFTPETFRKKFYHPSSSVKRREKAAQIKYILLHGVPAAESYPVLASALKTVRAQSIVVAEMRPELWGARIVASELLRRNLPATLVSDNMMGTLFAQGQIGKVFLFHRGLTESGPNGYTGALLAAELARIHGVELELQPSTSNLGAPLDSDVSTLLGERVVPQRVPIHRLEPEVVSWEMCGQSRRSRP